MKESVFPFVGDECGQEEACFIQVDTSDPILGIEFGGSSGSTQVMEDFIQGLCLVVFLQDGFVKVIGM